jgi:hypothetical protein
MKIMLSAAVFVASILSAVAFVFVAFTELPYAVTQDSEGWGSMIYRYRTAPLIAATTLLLAVVSSALLRSKEKAQLDRISLLTASITFGLVVVSWLIIEPLRNWVIFRN